MNSTFSLFFCCSLFITLFAPEKLSEESFIAQPKPKKESRNTINEATGRTILLNNKKSTQLIKYIADLEELLIDQNDILQCQKQNNASSKQDYRTIQLELTNTLDSCYKLLLQIKTKLQNVITQLINKSFITQPKPQAESQSLINEATDYTILSTIKKCAQLIKYIAGLEEVLIDHGDILLCQEKNSFFVTAEIKQLQEYRTTQQELTSTLDSCYKLVQQTKTKLNKFLI